MPQIPHKNESSETRIRLITRGDDAGCNATSNTGLREAYRKGILKNLSVLAMGPALDEAAEMFAGETGLCCGVHTCLNAEWDRVRWGPVLPVEEVKSLVDANGHFLQTTRALHERRPDSDEIFREIQAQLDRLRNTGFDIKYADSHMGWLWVSEGLDERFAQWCEREGLLNASLYHRPWPRVEAQGDPVERLLARLEAAEPGQYVLVAHPAYDNDEMRSLGHDGYPGETVAAEREWERRLFTDPRILAYCEANQVKPIWYDEALPIHPSD